MKHDLFPQHWLVNTLLDDGFIVKKALELGQHPVPYAIDEWLKQHFDPATLAARNEAQLEEVFISPLLAQLGWSKVYQAGLTVQGKFAKPDYCLLLEPETEHTLIASRDHTLVTAICESKAWDKVLDTGKADRTKNPHHQLQDYLSTLRVRFGFLTNGRIWRVYDTDKITAKKTYIEFDLQRLMLVEDREKRTEGLALFAFFFGKRTYVNEIGATIAPPIQQAIDASADFTLAVEENLKAVIYGYAGEDSLFEIMGRAIHHSNPTASLADVYENSVVLLFRLLFVVYFEDKNAALLSKHPFYSRYSLGHIYATLRELPQQFDGMYDGVHGLKQLFEMLDEGAEDIDIPLFNGGLFDPSRAPLLLKPKMFPNVVLRQLLEKLCYKTHRGNTLFDTRRDFKNMSVTHLGRIYEGLLEFRFERATQNAVYLEYESNATKGRIIEAYFDAYDTAQIRKEKGFRGYREIAVKQGDVFLKSASNSRKTTASYYTEPVLSQPLVKSSVDHAIAAATAAGSPDGQAFMDLKILDNACGSGHFLVEALNYLTDLALDRLDTDKDLQKLVAEESAKIIEQLRFLNLDYVPEDAQILKRALLKRCIFGVDLNPFAVELARLSLWMDSFIFGTPLSFIEHHVQHGNSLMGATVQDFIDYNAVEVQQNDLFVENLSARFDELRIVMHELDAMRDTTAQEVEKSKDLWRNQIAPKLNLLSRALSFICTGRAMLAEGNHTARESLRKTPDLLSQLFDDTKSKSPALKQIEAYAKRYRFFHFEVAFPEAFAGNKRGFDIIVGNPPWDKTKFSDADFFPQFHSNYRSLKNSEKDAVKKRLLETSHIESAYAETQVVVEVANNYFKAAFPLNRGAGDGNLFRFFVERNLGLLAKGGSLNYVVPSALMFEEGSTALRRHIFEQCQMPFFYSFENNRGIFPDVHRSYKFALLQIVNSPPSAAGENFIDTAFYVLDPSELQQEERHIKYPLEVLKTLSPDQWALMELRDQKDLPILQKCYSAFPPLSPKWLDFRNELHMTSDKDLFVEKQSAGLLPLFEGKMIWQYQTNYDVAQYWLSPEKFDARLESKEIHRMAGDLGVKKAQVSQQTSAIRYDREFIRLGFRTVARDTDERTLIFALLPKHCGFGHSMFANSPKRYVVKSNGDVDVEVVSALRLLTALAMFNSVPMDWLARQMIQINVSQTYIYRLPMPQPTDEEILVDPRFTELAKNALLLCLSNDPNEFDSMRSLFGIQLGDVPSTAKSCDKLRARNDKLMATIYGISDSELEHILESFKVMRNKRPEYFTLLQ